MTAPALPETRLDVPIVDLLAPGAVAGHFRAQEKPVDAVPTPFATWNWHCRDDGGGVGLARGWHVTLAGNTGTGKSLLGLNCAATAIEAGERVGFLSIEMSEAQVATRLYAILTGTDVRELERGDHYSRNAAQAVERRVAEIAERTGGAFYVNRRPIFDVESVVGLARYFHESKGCGYFVTDYLQLLAARDADTLFAQVSNVSARLREFAKQLGVVSLGLSQFNRSTSADYSRSPHVQGLMGASSLENDADQVVLLDHSRYKRLEDERSALTWALLAKNRHGGQGDIPIEWDYRTLRVREGGRHEEDAWP